MTKDFKQVGITPEGKLVMGGVFKFYDTKGMPLPILFMLMQDNNMIPQPLMFYDDATKGGWKHKTIMSKLEEAYCDSYGKMFWESVKPRLVNYSTTNNPIV